MMSDPSILFVKPKAISDEDKDTLRNAGIIVVEIENINDAKFVRPHSELSGSQLLHAAAKAVSSSDHATTVFGRAVAHALMEEG